MKTFKKIIAFTLAAVMVAAVSVGATVAYLQDDDSDVNVMTLGNVEIEQIEKEWNKDKTELVDFTQAKPLYPYVGTLGWENREQDGGAYRRFTMNNVVDKYVTVKNTGKSDAYVRTIIALEMGDYTDLTSFAGSGIGLSTNAENGSEFKFDGAWNWTEDFVAEIDGKYYNIMVAVHKNAVEPGKETIPSLLQVYLSKDAGNEEVEKLDGNDNGTYDILVLSQAVQTNGFEDAQTALDTAFGKVSEKAAEWFGGEEFEIPNILYSYNDVCEVYGKDGKYVLGDDIDALDMVYFAPGSTVGINFNGKTITAANKGQYAIAAPPGSVLTLDGDGTIESGKGFFATDSGKIIINGGTYNTTVTGTLDGIKHTSLAQNNNSTIIINDGTFTTNVVDAVLFYATSNARIEINGGFFENTADETPDLLGIGKNKYNTNRIILKGGTFVNYNPLEDNMCYKGAWPATGESAFGGPWILIPGDYEVVSETQTNGDIWYTVVAK